MTRQHRHQISHPVLWAAIQGAIRDAMAMHPDIQIPDRRVASIVKRATGQVLALQGAGAGKPAAKVTSKSEGTSPVAAQAVGRDGGGSFSGRPHTPRPGGTTP